MKRTTDEHVTIRFSRPDDAAEISRLAQLDSTRPPQARMLVAEVAGEIRAALPVDGGAALADPFRHTADLVSLLEVRRRQTHLIEPEISGGGIMPTFRRRGRVARHDGQAERPDRHSSSRRRYALPLVRELRSLPGSALGSAPVSYTHLTLPTTPYV